MLAAATRHEEIRRVTVLFADIVESTALVAGADAAEARIRLERPLLRLRAAVRQFGGGVVRVAGDGILALFGAPVSLEEHALHACLAALRMKAGMAGANGAGAVRLRIGINTGNVLVRSVRTDFHVEYSAHGETVHLAAKAQQAARPGGILALQEVARLVKDHVALEPCPCLPVKGLADPVAAFEVKGVIGHGDRFQSVISRGLTDFVGRTGALRILHQIARRTAGCHPGFVTLTGDPGVGKSRLAWEFTSALGVAGWRTLRVGARLGAASVALAPFRDILRDLHGLEPGDDETTIRHALSNTVPGPDLPAILSLFDLAPVDAAWDVMDVKVRMERTREALTRALLGACASNPTAIVVSDFHHADPETVSLFRFLFERARHGALLVLVESRFELPGPPDPRLHRIVLEPLSEAEARALFRSLAGPHDSLHDLERKLVERVAGNPLFVEEGVRMLAERGALVGAPGAYRCTSPGADIEIPPSMVDLLQTRIGRLDGTSRRVLDLACVAGLSLPMLLLRQLADVEAEALTRTLGSLVEFGLLVSKLDRTHGDYAFRHAVVAEVAYAMLSPEQAAGLHAQVVQVLESRHVEWLIDRQEMLAHHSLRARQWSRAVQYLLIAARRSMARSAPRESLRTLQQALDATGHLQAAAEGVDREIDVRFAMRSCLLALGHIQLIGEHLARLETLGHFCTDPLRRARVAVFTAGHRWLTGALDQAVEAGRQALEVGTVTQDFSLLVPARQYVGGALHELGRFAEAEALLSENVDAVPEEATGTHFAMAGMPAVFCRSTRSWLRGHAGRYDEADRDAWEALRIARAGGHDFSVLSASFTLAALRLQTMAFADAQRHLEPSLELCEQTRQSMWLPVIGSMLGRSLAAQGQSGLAGQVLDRTIRKEAGTGFTTYMLITLAQARAALGDEDAVAALVETIVRRSSDGVAPLWLAEARHLAGDHFLRKGEAEIARQAFQQGLDDADRLGLPPLAARCIFGLGRAHRQNGEASMAEERLTTAFQKFRKLKLDIWAGWVETMLARTPERGS